MPTVTVYSGTGDGKVNSAHGTYANARSGSGATLTVDTTSTTTLDTGQYELFGYNILQGFLAFDTTVVTGTPTAATLSGYGSNAGSGTWICEVRIFPFGTVTTADFTPGDNLAAVTPLVATLTIVATAGWTNGAYNAFTSDAAFPGAINTAGLTELMLSSQNQRVNVAPPGGSFEALAMYPADDAGTTRDPMLVVVFDAAPTPFIPHRMPLGV